MDSYLHFRKLAPHVLTGQKVLWYKSVKARRISTGFYEFRRIIPCHPSNFDEIVGFQRNLFLKPISTICPYKVLFFHVFNKSPKLRSFCSSVLFCGSTSFRYSYILSRLAPSLPALLRYCRTI